MKLQKLLDQQVALAKQIDELRKAETQAKKAADVARAQSRKAAAIRAVEKAGLLDFDPAVLAAEFQKIANTLKSATTKPVPDPAATGTQIFEEGE